jgi:DNA-binding transcriptional regulator GbsR (MarR family)
MPPFVPGSATSARAAASVRDVRHGVGAKILAHIITSPRGLTCDQIEQQLKLSHQTVSARLSELSGAECVITNGEIRVTRYGQHANVYVATAKASTALYQRHLKTKRIQNESYAQVRMQEKVVLQYAHEYGRRPSASGLENMADAAKKLHLELQRHRGLV